MSDRETRFDKTEVKGNPSEPTQSELDAAADALIDDEHKESYYMASSWQLMWRKFIQHKLAIVGGAVIIGLYLVGVVFTGFFSTHDIAQRHPDHAYVPPQRIRIFHEGGFRRPFVYGLTKSKDPVTWRITYHDDTSQIYPVRFFTRGDEYELWGLIPANVRLLGVDEPGTLFLFGTGGRTWADLVVGVSPFSGPSAGIDIGSGVSFGWAIGYILIPDAENPITPDAPLKWNNSITGAG